MPQYPSTNLVPVYQTSLCCASCSYDVKHTVEVTDILSRPFILKGTAERLSKTVNKALSTLCVLSFTIICLCIYNWEQSGFMKNMLHPTTQMIHCIYRDGTIYDIIVYRNKKRPRLLIVQNFEYCDNRHNRHYRIIAIILNLLSILKGVDWSTA